MGQQIVEADISNVQTCWWTAESVLPLLHSLATLPMTDHSVALHRQRQCVGSWNRVNLAMLIDSLLVLAHECTSIFRWTQQASRKKGEGQGHSTERSARPAAAAALGRSPQAAHAAPAQQPRAPDSSRRKGRESKARVAASACAAGQQRPSEAGAAGRAQLRQRRYRYTTVEAPCRSAREQKRCSGAAHCLATDCAGCAAREGQRMAHRRPDTDASVTCSVHAGHIPIPTQSRLKTQRTCQCPLRCRKQGTAAEADPEGRREPGSSYVLSLPTRTHHRHDGALRAMLRP